MARGAAAGLRGASGFTLLELLVVITVIALGTGLAMLSLRDGSRDRLEQEAARLAALLEAARVESRVNGQAITWRPLTGAERSGGPTTGEFVFEPPVHKSMNNASRWLYQGTQAEIVGASRLVLGPEPLIAPQRMVLRLGEQQLVLATDGFSAFQVEPAK